MACRVKQMGKAIGEPNASQWHVEGVRPPSQSHSVLFHSPDHQTNANLLKKCENDRNNKYNDGLKQAMEHVKLNSSDFALFFPPVQISDRCFHLKFNQTICRKQNCDQLSGQLQREIRMIEDEDENEKQIFNKDDDNDEQ